MTTTLLGFKSHGIREPLTNRIAGILDEYPDGTQIARELLQNSDDARSTEQWYLLDHHSYIKDKNDLRLFHDDLKEYMGPALLAGNDSLFEEKDFKSMKNLAASEKRNDATKIGQMGIGFNRSDFIEGAVRGNFTEGNQGLNIFPDQLEAFSILEDIDFTRSYPGTIFRFPLRTAKQAETSKLSSNAYPAERVLEMLLKLKNEALKAMLFLKHIERIAIYERRCLEEGPKKVFEIEIVNAKEVRKERQDLLTKLRSHVYPESTASRDTILEYSIRPIFKLTQDDGTSTLEHWHISAVVGNSLMSRDFMEKETEGNLDAHKLIPWVGIAAPSEPGVMIASSRLFCFLPISIQHPFPVHINGHFAVKQSRREIWTNQDNDFAKHASAYIKSVWNVHLFHTHVPLVYAKFLTDLGLARGANYDLWPTSCGLGIGLDAIWKDLLTNLVHVICRDNLKVFFCKSDDDDHYLTDYKSLWIADRDIDSYPLLAETLQRFTNVAVGLPDAVIRTIPNVIGSLGLESRILTPGLVRRLLREHKDQWSSTASSEARVEMLKYCIQDDDIKDLEGLPLLPLAGGLWVEFNISQARARYLVKQETFTVLLHSSEGLVDIEFDSLLVKRFYTIKAFHVFWSEIDNSVISAKIKDTYDRLFYSDCSKTKSCIPRPVNGFPTTKWILDFWVMVRLRPDQKSLLSMVENLHLLPITRQRLAPLARDLPVVYLDRIKDNNRSTLAPFVNVLDDHLGCRVMQDDSGNWEGIAADYIFEISDASKVLGILSEISPENLVNLGQRQSKTSCQYMSQWLSPQTHLDEKRLCTLKTLPIYQTYDESTFVSLQYPESGRSKWRVAKDFFYHENPWLPKSISLLADGQAMLEHLTKLVNVLVVRESGYWVEILGHLKEYPENEWDTIVEKFCEKYHVHCKDYDFTPIMADLPFVRATGPRKPDARSVPQLRLSPREIVTPSFSPFFTDDESLFPYGVYTKPSILNVLTEIGIRSTFNTDFVLDRVEKLSSYATANGAQSIRGIFFDFYAKLNVAFSNKLHSAKLQDDLRQQPWIFASKSPEEEQRCYIPAECRPVSEKVLLGSELPLSQFQFTNESLIECMGWDQPPPLDKVLANFLILIKQASLGSQNGGSKPDEVKFIAIYRYLKEQAKDMKALATIKETLGSLPWILVDGELHPVRKVALSMDFNLAPHFVQIKLVGLDDLFIAMGVRRTVGKTDLEGIVSGIGSQYEMDESLSAIDAELIIELLRYIAIANIAWSPRLLILTRDNRLCKITEVVYDDLTEKNAISLEEDDQYTFVSSKIDVSTASALQIPMYSARYWNDQRDSTFEPWAQEEDIVARIGNILNDYDPSSIFMEFLQNAADAGATKCSFMLDQRSFGKNKVLSKEMEAWQGPALVIYNDAEFTESDFKALSKLGEGNKRGDSSKIGRHGLGFNSVYHFTDIPSVVSGSYIGFFDPKRECLPKVRTPDGWVRQGGTRSNFLKLVSDIVSDQLQPYKGLFGCDMKSHYKGTIFRIPLRIADTQMNSSRKSIIDSYWTLTDMRDMLRRWVEDAKVGMLFLDNIKSVEITTMSNGSSYEPKFTWLAEKSFTTDKPHRDRAIREGNNASTSTQIADIRTTSSAVALRDSQRWLIHTDIGYPDHVPQSMKDLASNNRWYSHRGIAIPINWKYKGGPFNGRLFTHLPTPIVTEIPFHIHGGFALTSNRKNLAGGVDHASPQYKWNEFMMDRLLPQSAMTALEKLLIYLFWGLNDRPSKLCEIDNATDIYFKYWPTKTRPDFEPFVELFSRNSYLRPVYPVYVLNQDVNVRFVVGRDVLFPELYGASKATELMIREYMRKQGVAICECPSPIQTRLRGDWRLEPSLNFKAINEDSVRKLIKDEPEFIKQFVKIDDIRWVLDYTLKTILDPKKTPKVSVTGLHLLPLMDKTWKPLAPSSACYFAKVEMRELIDGGNYLINESVFRNPVPFVLNGGVITAFQLEAIYKRLTSDATYGVTQLPPAKFTAIFNSENPNGPTDKQREKLWGLVGMSEDLEVYGELPILKTLNGDHVQLKYYKSGIEVSHLNTQTKRQMERLSSLMTDLGIIVFDANQNKRHPRLIDPAERFTDTMILTCISRRCSAWPEGRELTTEEAEVLRGMIKLDIDLSNWNAYRLGTLRIWPCWDLRSSQTPRLIPAKNSFFIEGNYSLENLGDNSDVIQSTYCKHFRAMGANPLNVVTAAASRVLPRLLDNSLECSNSQTMSAYTCMISDVLRVANGRNNIQATQARKFLSTSRFILARDGNFRTGQELFDPSDELLAVVFSDEPSKFPNHHVWQTAGGYLMKRWCRLRDGGDLGVIHECAQHVLMLTNIHSAPSDPQTRTKAISLIRHIYTRCGVIDWMNPEWKIVPAEVAQDPQYNGYLPNLPEFVSFSEIVDPSHRDICWTQCAFFPERLKPSSAFKLQFPSVGKLKVGVVVSHLSVLVSDIAKAWVSFDQQPVLKMLLFKVYKFLDEFSEKGPSNAALLQKELTARLRVPYILNGYDKDPSMEDSWLWPSQLMLDIDNDIGRHQVVHHSLKSIRGFLVAAGVEQMKTVEGRVEVPEGRRKGDLETRLLNCFESQDKHNGFMDILFQFDNCKQIMVHKFVLVHANEYFATRFTGAWADYTTRDTLNPGVEVIDFSNLDGDETFESFWGLLYYFYTDNLIHTNGPPTLQSLETTSDQANVDILRDRVQYLMELLCLADQYQTKRLKALIAMEVVSGHKVLHSNVFSVRKFAMLYNSKDIKEHCEKYLKVNLSSVGTYLRGELQVYKQSLAKLIGDGDGAEKVELVLEINEIEDNLKELNELF
ncbi:hypothetical protein BGX20_000948 [Mortierella sp. AD010]|nr:hypothetical protein BGX20_000948 [Mortierella sp. AD010]